MRPRSIGLLCATALATLAVASAHAKPVKPPLCAAGRFLVAGDALVVGDGTPGHEPIVLGGSHVALGSACPAVKVKLKATKTGTRLTATWPACQGLHGRVKMTATVAPSCDSVAGTLTAKKAKVKEPFTAKLSRCGDGTLDAGAGEECDPPSVGSCDATCRNITTTAMVGVAGGRVTSADGLFTLDVPAGALSSDVSITVHRLEPGDIPQALVDAGAESAYDLGPDGLQFGSPATATVRVGEAKVAPDGSLSTNLVTLLTTSAGGSLLAPLGTQRMLFDAVADVTSAIGDLGHFSQISPIRKAFNHIAFQVTITLKPDPLCAGQPFSVNIQVTIDQALLGDIDVNYADHTAPDGVLQYEGAPQLKLGTLKAGDRTFKGTVAGYSCGDPGNGTFEVDIAFPGYGTIHVKAPQKCVDCTASTTTTTTTGGSVTTSTARPTTSTKPSTTVTATTAPTSTTESTSTSTSTTSTSTSSTSTSSSTTSSTGPPGCCDCNPGCSEGPQIPTPEICARTGNASVCPGGKAGTFIPNAVCEGSPGVCSKVTTSTTVPPPTTSTTSVPVTTTTLLGTTTTTTQPTTTTTLVRTSIRVDVPSASNTCGGTDLTNPAATPPFAGSGLDGQTVINLAKDCIYFGDGSDTLPFRPRFGPGTFYMEASQDGTLSPDTTHGPTGCSRGAGPGRHCLNGSVGTGGGQCTTSEDCHQPCVKGQGQTAGICNGANPPRTCLSDADCASVTVPPDTCALDPNCFLGSRVVLPNLVTPTPQFCLVTHFIDDVSGSIDLAQGKASVVTTLGMNVYTGPCPICGSLGKCSGGTNNGATCKSTLDCPPSGHLALLTQPVELSTGVSTVPTGPGGSLCAGFGVGAFGNAGITELFTTGTAAGPIGPTPKPITLGDAGCGPLGPYWAALAGAISAPPITPGGL